MTSRRTFLKASASLALVPLVNLNVKAAEKVPLDDVAAKALKYVEDASQAARADKMGYAAAEQFCHNCQFYAKASEANGWAGCALFQNRLVPGEGWCAGWVPTQG